MTQDNCNLYYQANNAIKTTLVRGVRSGFVSILDGHGHERLEYKYIHNDADVDSDEDSDADAQEGSGSGSGSGSEEEPPAASDSRWNDPQKRKLHNFIEFTRTRGTVEIHIKKLVVSAYMNKPIDTNSTNNTNTPGYLIAVNGDAIEIDVEMTAHQALNGFEIEIPYINEKKLKISRKNKITFPGSNSTVPGLGLPKTQSRVGNYEDVKENQGNQEGSPETDPEYVQNNDENETISTDLTGEEDRDRDTTEYDDLLVRFHLINLYTDTESDMVYSEKVQHDRDEYKRIQALCSNTNSTSGGSSNGDGMPIFNVTNSNGKRTLHIGSTNGENVVISGSGNINLNIDAGDAFQSDAGADVGLGAGEVNQTETENGTENGGSDGDQPHNCTGSDYVQYLEYKEDKKMRKLLLLLQKKREEEEASKVG